MTSATKAPAAPVAPAEPVAPKADQQHQPDEPPERRCTRCGGVGTHFLTCPDLRLPPGFRLSASATPAGSSRPAHAGEARTTAR